MTGKVKCTCGWSWNKSDSSKKDMYICHECGRDNSNNMKNGGWLDSYEDGGTMQEHQENYNDSSVSLPEGFVGEGYNTKGRNYSPAWGGQFQMGGSVYPVNYVPEAQMGASIPGAVGFSYARTQSPAPSNGKYAKKTMASAQNGIKKPIPSLKEFRESLKKDKVVDYKERPREVVKESIQAPKLPSRKNIKESTLTEKGNVKRDNKGRVVIQNDKGVYTPYKPGVDQVTLTQDNRSTEVQEKLKEYSNAVRNPSMIDRVAFLGELPLNYLSDPTKILGDLGIQGVNNSSEDFNSFVEEINYPFPTSNSLQRGLERQLPKVPSAALNLALASIGTNSTGQFVNNLTNPLAGTENLVNNLGNKYLPNAYKLNPWAFKPNESNYYRQIPKQNNAQSSFIKQDLSEGNNIKYSFTDKQGNNIGTFSGRKNPEGVYVNSIEINPELRRQGLASKIYKDIAKDLQSKNEGTLFSRSTQHQFTDKDKLGRSIAPANKLWENLVNKGEAEKFVEGMSHTYKIKPLKEGGVIKDDMGQWAHPGEITEIGSNQITMQGVPYDVLGISDTGDTKLMKPGKNYKFKGKKVTEYPMAKNGLRQEQKGLVNLDNLTNFTNYNTKQPGGWLDKY